MNQHIIDLLYTTKEVLDLQEDSNLKHSLMQELDDLEYNLRIQRIDLELSFNRLKRMRYYLENNQFKEAAQYVLELGGLL